MNESANKTFSICVMTYNRGAKALNVAQTLLPELEHNWELLFLDNASIEEVDSYRQLEAFAAGDQRLRYVRHDKNRGFHRNYLACFEMAAAPHIMIMSDEDFANPDMIRNVLPLLQQYPTVGVMRGSIAPVEGVAPKNSHNRSDTSWMSGEEAIMGFAFSNNYFSGTIYNRQLLIELGLIARLASGIEKHGIYPHLYLELLTGSLTDIVTTTQICCFEGEAQIASHNNPLNYAAPYSFGSRVDQFIVLRDAIREAVLLVNNDFNLELFVKIYLKLCNKYFYLISTVNSPMYVKNSIHPGLLHQSMLYICGAAIAMYPEIQSCDTEIYAAIQKIHANYEMFSEQA